MLKKMPGSFTKDSAEFLGNVQESFGESKCQFVSWNLACFVIKFCY